MVSSNVRRITLLTLPTECLLAGIAGLQPNWVAATGIWPLTHSCPFPLRHTYLLHFYGFSFFFFLCMGEAFFCWWKLHLTFRVGTHKPVLARGQSSWSSVESSSQAAGGKEMTWSHCQLLCWLLGCSLARSPCCSRAKSCWVLSSLAFQHTGYLRQTLPQAGQKIDTGCRKYDAIC